MGLPAERLRLGNYEPLLQLATGGMASVYVARQIGAAGFERLVVVKRVHKHLVANHDFSDMLRDEARVASMIRHPNVAPVIDVVEAEGELFLVMEYIESSALSSLLKAASDARTRVPPAIAARIALDTLAGLHAAHEVTDIRGNHLEVVHRDVSPQNVVVGVDGTSRLIDFGVAKARHRITETKSGSLKGKYGYMSPEQARAQPVDRRADIFSCAIVFHETLTGRRLFQGEHELDTLRRIVEAPVPKPSSIARDVPESLDEVLLRALQRAPDARYQSAAEMADAIESAIVPASTREVAAFLQQLCGERLARRRATLAAMMEGRVDPLDASASGDRLTLPSSPSAILRREAARAAAAEASVHGASMSMRPAPRRWTLAATAAVLLAVGVGIGIGVSRTGDAPRQAAAIAGSVVGAASDALRAATAIGATVDATATAPPTATAPTTSPATAPASAAKTTKPPRKPPAPARTNELQSNPYGQP
jgi:serine/threonine-protein kinase